jgi:hypothetical protein
MQKERRRWARKWEHCQRCGTKEWKHHGKGYCDVCYPRVFCGTIQEYVPRPHWCRLWVSCVNCGTTDVPHKGKGLCVGCYHEIYEKINPRRSRKNYV